MTTKLTYAGRAERLFAYLLDALVLLIPTAVLMQALGGIHESGATGPQVLAIFVLNLLYRVGFSASIWQATPGKRLLNIYIIHADGSRLTPRDALERHLAFVLPSLPVYSSMVAENAAVTLAMTLSMLWFVPILTTPERIGMHDRICRTRVVVGKVG